MYFKNQSFYPLNTFTEADNNIIRFKDANLIIINKKTSARFRSGIKPSSSLHFHS
jgi:hypothetical protein